MPLPLQQNHSLKPASQATPVVDDGVAPFVVIMALGALLAVYSETIVSVVNMWFASDTYTHGMLIVPVSIYLVVRRRRLLANAVPRVTAPGFVALALLTVVWILARLTGVLVVEQLCVVGMVAALVWTLAGAEIFSLLAFALGYLVFAVPIGEFLVPVLMDWTAWATVAALKLVSVPVYREALYFSIPSGDFEVARACSGVRYVIASLAVGVLFAHLTYRRSWKRGLFVVLAVAIPVLANAMRAFAIVMIAHISNMNLAVGFDHLLYGWVFFGIVMLALFSIGQTFRDPAVEAPGTQVSTTTEPASSTGTFMAGATIALAIVAAGPLVAKHLQISANAARQPVELSAPTALSGWQRADIAAPQWQPEYHNEQQRIHAGYTSATGAVDLHVSLYTDLAQGSELVNDANQLVDPDEWQVIASTQRELPVEERFTITETRLRSGSTELLVWHWFDVNGSRTQSRRQVKLNEIWSVVRGRHRYSALIALVTRVTDTPAAGRASLEAFAQAHAAAIAPLLERPASTPPM